MKKKGRIVLFFLFILILLMIYIAICLYKYPQVVLNKEDLYQNHTERLKDFEITETGLRATTNDPWIDVFLDNMMPIRTFEVDVVDVNSLGGMCEIFETENWKSIRHVLETGKNYIYLYNSSEGTWYEKNLRLDLVEVENATIQIDKVVINSQYSIIRYSVIKFFSLIAVFIVIISLFKKLSNDTIDFVNNTGIQISMKKLLGISASMIMSAYIMIYMRLPQGGLLWLVTATGLCTLFKQKKASINKVESVIFLLYSFLFSIANIMGMHIITNGNFYFGLLNENYITSYTFNDIVGLFVLTYVFWRLLVWGYNKFTLNYNKVDLHCNTVKVDIKVCIPIALVLFALWIPYFVVYYPGFIFPDSLSSIYQALGAPLNNHHPIVYTLFIKVCLRFGMIIKDITFGCAIYTIIQMAYIAFALGYMICWLKGKGVSRRICIIIMLCFGFLPFIAQNSIAMWKDPIFSASILLWSIHLFDYVLSDGEILNSDKYYLIKSCLLILLICFSRNNGFYLILVSELVFIILLILKRKEKNVELRKICFSTGVMLIIVYLITGPVYSKLGIKEEKVESLGIFLNQMARVAAYDGNMSKEDREFMDNLLPLEKYAETYRPCVVDLLKWDEDFNEDFLKGRTKEFIRTYFSLMIKNPRLYIEAWELNTFGYWAPNYWEFFDDEDNITKGDLPSFYIWDHKGISPKNLLDNVQIDWNSILKNKGRAIYLAVINWLVFLIIAVIFAKRKLNYLMFLAPSLGLIATLLIATPYVYWQRYGLAEYYLLPVYLFVLVCVLTNNSCEIQEET